MVAQLYRNIVPASLRDYIYAAFLGSFLHYMRHIRVHIKSKFTFLFSWFLPKTEENAALAFIGRHGLTSYPYPYSLEYKNKKPQVLVDISNNLPYIIHNGRKLFFPPTMIHTVIATLYVSLITEQDARSAHRYVASYDELRGKTLLDIGSAEGIFSLDTIDFVDHVYLFEYESFWQESLKATFAPWAHKVTIIPNYVGDTTEGIVIKIDDFLKDKPKDNIFLKMDIEGAEQSALRGAIETLKNGKNVQVAVCTYHRPDDPKVISELLGSLGYKYEFTQGMLYWGKRLSKALIRGNKQ